MTKGLSRDRSFSEKEKKKIARELKEGYKKMASLNRELAQDFFVRFKGETDK